MSEPDTTREDILSAHAEFAERLEVAIERGRVRRDRKWGQDMAMHLTDKERESDDTQ